MKNKIIGLAPLAGVSDRPFRRLAFEWGADFAVTEMISAKGLYYKSKKTADLMATDPCEKNLFIQLFGHEPDIMSQVIREQINPRVDFAAIDLNMGCPAPKIVKNDDGSALMQDPLLAGRMIGAMVKASNKPISVKFRLGFDEEHINYMEIGHIAQEEGAFQVTLHARTREQMYSGRASWEAIAKLKESLKIPVIGNGDVVSPETAYALLQETACDGIAIGRAAMGNPFLFDQIKDYFSKGSYQKTDLDTILEAIHCHYEREIEERGDYGALLVMRKHIASYLDSFYGANQVKKKINESRSKEEVYRHLNDFRRMTLSHNNGED